MPAYRALHFSVHQLAFERNQQTLFSKIHFEVNAGEILQLRGANGSGKSTLLRILAGFIEPHHGKVSFNNQDIQEIRCEFQRETHYLGHQNGIKPYLTVEENLQLTSALNGKPFESSTLSEALSITGIERLKDTTAMHLSAGQARRLSLTRLLLQRAPLWFLDEPTTALDNAGEAMFNHMLSQHLAQGGSAIIATHHELNLPRTLKTLWLGE